MAVAIVFKCHRRFAWTTAGSRMDFTAIDFETASHRKDSACQLAAVRVSEGKIIDSANWLIRPVPAYFNPSNIRIHGITPDQVADERTFGQLWPDIQPWLEDQILVAHNAAFDIGVLRACLQQHRCEIPELSFTCTRAIAKRTWPDRRRYGLKPLATWLGVDFRHHDALEDSIACAKILLAAGISRKAESVADLESRLGLARGGAGPWGYRGATTQRHRRSRQASQANDTALSTPTPPHSEPEDTPGVDFQRLLIRAQFIQPLAGQRIVFTGRLRVLQREQAERLACESGGQCQGNVNGKTSLLVRGCPDERTAAAGRTESVKEQTARQRRAAGQNIRVLDEKEFLGLILGTDTVGQWVGEESDQS